jgi:hypothetical protein
VSEDWAKGDLARLLALEHAFGVLALVSAGNFSFLAKCTAEDAIKQFREAIEGSMLDTRDIPAEVNLLMRKHLKQLLDHVQLMARNSDESAKAAEA